VHMRREINADYGNTYIHMSGEIGVYEQGNICM